MFYQKLTLNSGTVISKECLLIWPDELATVNMRVTNGELRFLQQSDVMPTPSFHFMSTNWPTFSSLFASSGEDKALPWKNQMMFTHCNCYKDGARVKS